MLYQATHELTIPTRGRGLYEFTREVGAWVATNSFKNGLVTLHVRHTSASLLIQENADPDVRADWKGFLNGLSPTATHCSSTPARETTICRRTFARR